jgi:hypothetical protein
LTDNTIMKVAALRRFSLIPTIGGAFLASILCLLVLFTPGSASADAFVPRNSAKRVQDVIDELAAKLALNQTVSAVLVRSNPLLVSVERQNGQKTGYVLSFEDGFLDGLPDDELRAVVAHELGHVWIFTHHPFLQTEQGANSIAMRVVSRGSLERVYGKVWERGGVKGDLTRFLGK